MNHKTLFDQLLQAALSKNASVIIANDVVNFRDPDNIAYKIGIQSTGSKYLKGFCYLFWVAEYGASLYFKHDMDQIQGIYAQHPDVIPSEIATQYWSRTQLSDTSDPAFLLGLIDRAYDLALQTMPKGEQAKIKSITTPNNAWAFHLLGLRLKSMDTHWHLDYNTGPKIRYRVHLIAILEHHQLRLRGSVLPDQADWEPRMWAAVS